MSHDKLWTVILLVGLVLMILGGTLNKQHYGLGLPQFLSDHRGLVGIICSLGGTAIFMAYWFWPAKKPADKAARQEERNGENDRKDDRDAD